MFILKVIQAFQKARVNFAICGGQAVAFHGAVRGTVDIDIVVGLDEANLNKAEQILLTELKLVSRIPVGSKEIIQFRKEFITKKNLKAWSFVNPNRVSEIVDILILDDISSYKIVEKKAWGIAVPVVSIADLIKMKKESGRPQDLSDIEALTFLNKQERQRKNKK